MGEGALRVRARKLDYRSCYVEGRVQWIFSGEGGSSLTSPSPVSSSSQAVFKILISEHGIDSQRLRHTLHGT